jgi:hypothetical protein
VGQSYRVVLDDLVSAASTFAREGDEFRAIMPTLGPACPDGGDAALNQVLRTVVEATGLLHTQIAGALEHHASRLWQAHERYADAEDHVRHLCRHLIDAAGLT